MGRTRIEVVDIIPVYIHNTYIHIHTHIHTYTSIDKYEIERNQFQRFNYDDSIVPEYTVGHINTITVTRQREDCLLFIKPHAEAYNKYEALSVMLLFFIVRRATFLVASSLKAIPPHMTKPLAIKTPY